LDGYLEVLGVDVVFGVVVDDLVDGDVVVGEEFVGV